MAATAEELASLVTFILTPLVDFPDELEVSIDEDEEQILLNVHVNPDDAGKVIGRQGRVIKSIRTLARAAASRSNARVEVELAE